MSIFLEYLRKVKVDLNKNGKMLKELKESISELEEISGEQRNIQLKWLLTAKAKLKSCNSILEKIEELKQNIP